MSEAFDYIVVGAGSAGAVLAARLSEDPNVRVLLLEAGGSNKHWTVEMPLGVERVIDDPNRTWQFYTVPETHLNGRKIEQPRGKLLGGTSSINGMVYSRGHALDYDDWASEFGCDGWSFSEVLPYFRRSERYENGENEFRGGSGPLPVTIPDLSKNKLNQAFMESGARAGYPMTDDANGYQQEGFGTNQRTIENGTRCGTARMFLEPASDRKNLVISRNSVVSKVVIENRRATGVAYVQNGRSHVARCNREVILSAGAFGSPQLLMLSGIGPGSTLRSCGIEVLHDLPGVGENLHDHAEVLLQSWCGKSLSLYNASKGLARVVTGLEWFAARKGLAASNQFHAAAFIRTDAGVMRPDIKLEFFPIAYGSDLKPLRGDAFQVHTGLMRPKSRGRLSISSSDPLTSPSIFFNFLDHPDDVSVLIKAVKRVREILAQEPIANLSRSEISPGIAVQTDEQILDWMRQTLRGAYHPAGSCKMGRQNDDQAVVDPQLKVRGIDGLRVADASVMPLVTTSNTNAPTIMIAEKARDMILNKTALPRSAAGYWVNPNWQTRQK